MLILEGNMMKDIKWIFGNFQEYFHPSSHRIPNLEALANLSPDPIAVINVQKLEKEHGSHVAASPDAIILKVCI